MTEEWRPCFGFPRYEISNMGSVRWGCVDSYGRNRVGDAVKARSNWAGYMRVTLFEAGSRFDVSVHVLVLEAFVGQRPSGRHQAAHSDGVRSNNALVNLRWATPTENMADQRRHGTLIAGERQGNSRLCQEQVEAIRARCAVGERQRAIAEEFGVSQSCVSLIVRRSNWKHVA